MTFTHKQTGYPDDTHTTVENARDCEAMRAQELYDQAAFDGAAEAELAYERWLENGGPHAERIAWEHDMEMRQYRMYI